MKPLLARGVVVAAPEVSDYEVRRELIRLAATASLKRLDALVALALEGRFTQGERIEEVQANFVEATERWLEAAHEENRHAAFRGIPE
jgi:hypothetical protein